MKRALGERISVHACQIHTDPPPWQREQARSVLAEQEAVEVYERTKEP
jgi:hypothetical protein